jgi:hypothetical protein
LLERPKGLVNVGEKDAERQFSIPRNLFEALPEFILDSEARLMRANPDRPLSNS